MASLSDTRNSDVMQSKGIKAMRGITLHNSSGPVPGKDFHQMMMMMITKINKSEVAISNFRLEINRGFLITRIVLEELSVRDRSSGAEPQLLAIKNAVRWLGNFHKPDFASAVSCGTYC